MLKAHDVDADAVFAEVASGRPLATIKAEHTAYAASHDVWGVPTFIVGDQAAFVRFMHRPSGDGEVARRTVERVRRPARLARPQRVQAHLDPPLTTPTGVAGDRAVATSVRRMARPPQFDARMSEAESLMWRLEKDPYLSSTVANITVLDTAVDFDRFRCRLERASRIVPRLRQRVQPTPVSLTPPLWVDDPEFDLDYHVRHVALPEPGTLRQLCDLATLIAADPFDRTRPLWEFFVVDGLEGGQGAIIQKLHHTVADGEGSLRLSMQFIDLTRDAEDPPHAAGARARRGGTGATAVGRGDGARHRDRQPAHAHRHQPPVPRPARRPHPDPDGGRHPGPDGQGRDQPAQRRRVGPLAGVDAAVAQAAPGDPPQPAWTRPRRRPRSWAAP